MALGHAVRHLDYSLIYTAVDYMWMDTYMRGIQTKNQQSTICQIVKAKDAPLDRLLDSPAGGSFRASPTPADCWFVWYIIFTE